MISWKHSLKRLGEENEMAKKKKQALDSLLTAGKISQSTYDLFNSEIDYALMEIEKQQKALLEKMSAKMEELEGQVKTLEMLFANFEIQHVTGDVDEETYQREVGVLSVGIETAKTELETVKEAINQLSTDAQTLSGEVTLEQEPKPQIVENVEVAEEKLQESPVEKVEVREDSSFQAQGEKPQEVQPEEAKGEEKQEA